MARKSRSRRGPVAFGAPDIIDGVGMRKPHLGEEEFAGWGGEDLPLEEREDFILAERGGDPRPFTGGKIFSR